MQTISATEAKNKLAAVMDIAMKEPVMIEKNGRPFVVMMSAEAYEKSAGDRHKESFIQLCETLALTSKRRGMTEEILQSILNDKR